MWRRIIFSSRLCFQMSAPPTAVVMGALWLKLKCVWRHHVGWILLRPQVACNCETREAWFEYFPWLLRVRSVIETQDPVHWIQRPLNMKNTSCLKQKDVFRFIFIDFNVPKIHCFSTHLLYSLGQWFPNFLASDPKERLDIHPGSTLVKTADLQAHNAVI